MSFFKKIEDEAKDLTQKIENEASEIGQKIEDGVQEIKDDMELDMADPNAPVDEPPAATEEQIQAVMEKYDRKPMSVIGRECPGSSFGTCWLGSPFTASC